MSSATFTLVVESWRGLAHSYALVNQCQCLELLKIPGLQLYHRDAPFFGSHWTAVTGLFTREQERLLAAIPPPPPSLRPDAILRLAYPYNFAPADCGRLCVFGTAENMACPKGAVIGAGGGSLPLALRESGALLLTPSNWSREGFLRSGAPPQRVAVIPHGVDTELYRPPTDIQKAAHRQALGLGPGDFVFLNIGSLAPNKGALLLLKAFAEVAASHPSARLILKFNGALYSPKQFMEAAQRSITPAEQALIQPRLRLMQTQCSLADLALLYQASDAYVAPYFAEGFNLPALEACASGLPVICTAGGPTDDFLPPAVHLPVKSSRVKVAKPGENLMILEPDRLSLCEQMQRCLTDPGLLLHARECGPAHAVAHYRWETIVTRLLSELGRPI